MTRTLTFREIVKLIHPDHNPNVEDAGGKMRTAVLYKNQPEELYKLAIRWGFAGRINGGSTPVTPTSPKRTRITPAPRSNTVSTSTSTTTSTFSESFTYEPEPRYEWVADHNKVPEEGDTVVITTKEFIRVEVVRVTPKRIYYFRGGERKWANKTSVYVVNYQRIN